MGRNFITRCTRLKYFFNLLGRLKDWSLKGLAVYYRILHPSDLPSPGVKISPSLGLAVETYKLFIEQF